MILVYHNIKSIESLVMQCQDLRESAVTDMSEQQTVLCTFIDINKKQSQIYLKLNHNLAEIKQYIWENCCDSLIPKRMNIYCNSQKMTDGPPLSSFINANQTDQQPYIIQEKAELTQISNIYVSRSRIDEVSFEQLTARLDCGHFIGRENLIDMIRKFINMKRFRITCPQYDWQQDKVCGKEIKFSAIKRIGALTREECQEFEIMLSMNYLSFNTKICPFCGASVSKGNLKTNRVSCVGCHQDDFCYRCLQKWNGNGNFFCGNQTCKQVDKLLSTCPMSETFQLQLQNGQELIIMGPRYRSCPSCSELVQHLKLCKHMKCQSCDQQFCWICLSVRPQNQIWTCELSFKFCKPLAPPQCSQEHQDS